MPRYTRDVPAEYSEFERELAAAFGVRVRQRRRKLRLTQEQVRIRMETESVSISRDRFSRIEMGKALANAAEIFALAATLGVTYRWLMDGKEPVEGER